MADIGHRVVSNTTYNFDLYIKFTLTFAKDGQAATGTELVDAPSLDTANTPPVRTLFCQSPRQAMSLALQAPSSAPAGPPVQYVYDRTRHIIGEISR